MSTTVENDYFERLYGENSDPWLVRWRWYERRKQALLLACLPRERYRHAYEPACGTGELTKALAERCDAVLASDRAERAVETTRQAVTHLPHVEVQRHELPREWPAQTFDLIVLSEWAYYLSEADLVELARRCRQSLSADGTLIASHWRPDFEQRMQSTLHVHARLGFTGWTRLIHHAEHDFLMEAWTPQNISVARMEGIA
jgi:SAM-dependent methyltransferase